MLVLHVVAGHSVGIEIDSIRILRLLSTHIIFKKKVPRGIAKEEDEKLLQFGLQYRLQGTQFELCYIVFSIRNKPRINCDSIQLPSITPIISQSLITSETL